VLDDKSRKIRLHCERGEQDHQPFDWYGSNVFVDTPVAAQIPGGGPTDIDADKGVLGVIDHGAGQSHLSLLTYNAFGELTLSGAAINLGVPNANGVAILAPSERDDD